MSAVSASPSHTSEPRPPIDSNCVFDMITAMRVMAVMVLMISVMILMISVMVLVLSVIMIMKLTVMILLVTMP